MARTMREEIEMFLNFINKIFFQKQITIVVACSLLVVSGCSASQTKKTDSYYKLDVLEQSEPASKFYYELLDEKHNVVHGKNVRAKEIEFDMVTDALMKVSVRYGEGMDSVWCSYFNVQTGALSEEYSCVLYEDEQLVAYYYNDRIIVCDIFNIQNYYSELDMAGKNVDAANPDISIQKSENGENLLVEYGNVGQEHSQSMTIDLTEENLIPRIYEQNRYYSIYSGSHRDDYFGYYYDLYDENGSLYAHEYVGNVEPKITVLENNVVEVSLQSGTGIDTVQYVNGMRTE